jgi:RNA polymerase sigma-70 factor (ECF subfamily)
MIQRGRRPAAVEAPAGTVRPPHTDLLIAMRAGDLAAFETLFERYRGPVFRTAYGLTGDRQAAEEILQDTFARAWQWRDTLDPDVSPLPWLHRVALNLCYSRLGRRRLRSEPLADETSGVVRDPAAEPAESAERRELRQLVRERVAALPPNHRSVVVLYYLHDLSLRETADLLELRLGTVKSRLHYALRSLRSDLEADRRFGGAYGSPADAVTLDAVAVRPPPTAGR